MAEHFLTRRDPCSECGGTGINPKHMTDESWAAIKENKVLIPVKINNDAHMECSTCQGGHIEMRTDANEWLLDVLKKLRWTGTDGGVAGFIPHTQKFGEDLRIEDE